MTVNEYLANCNAQLQNDVDLKNYGDLEVTSYKVEVYVKLQDGKTRVYKSYCSNED